MASPARADRLASLHATMGLEEAKAGEHVNGDILNFDDRALSVGRLLLL